MGIRDYIHFGVMVLVAGAVILSFKEGNELVFGYVLAIVLLLAAVYIWEVFE